MRKLCKDCLHFDHCVNIPNYPVTENTIGCNDWESKDKYVPVVRCKECKHYHAETGYCNEHSHFIDSEGMSCSPAESPNWTMFDENDFAVTENERTVRGDGVCDS